ncbi:MAG: C/D box methylation guide ribonucleoprotein complex aNOP56 subunit [Promethearchaeia archaeon]
MKCWIIDTLIGIFAIDDRGTIVDFRDFDGEVDKIVEFYKYIRYEEDLGPYLDFFKKLLSELEDSGFTEFILDNFDLKSKLESQLEYNLRKDYTSLEFKNFRLNLPAQLKKIGITKSKQEIQEFYKQVNQELIKYHIKQEGAKNDVAIMQIIETLQTLKKTISLFASRLKEWYGLHFPELSDKIIDDNIVFSRLVSELGNKNKFTEENLETVLEGEKNLIKKIREQVSISMGADINLEMVKQFADEILDINEYRKALEDQLEDLMEDTAPNIKAIVGSLIGAKLISKAGSLKDLAYSPASRIQILGAEKALYRFLKTGDKRPKYGIIFQWKQIRSAKPWLRGKIARLIAGKIGLAAKVDYFSGDFIGDQYAEEIEEKIKELEKKYPEPPK